MKNLVRLLSLASKYKGLVALSIILGMATIASGIGLIGTSAYLISRAALRPSIAVLQVAIVGVRFFGISRGVFRYLERLVSHAVNLNILTRLRDWFFDTLEPIMPSSNLQFQTGDLLNRVIGDVDILENFYIRVVSPVIIAILMTTGMVLFIGTFSGSLAMVLLSGLLLSSIGVPLLSQQFRKQKQANLLHLRGNISEVFTESIQGLKDLLAFDIQQKKIREIESLETAHMDIQQELIWRESLVDSLTLILPNLTLWVTLVIAIPLVRVGGLDGVLLAVFALIALSTFEAVQPLGMAAQNLEMSLQAARRLFELQSVPPEVTPPAKPAILEPPIWLQTNNLSFSYRAEKIVLKDMQFELSPGKHIALVGQSGAGKTTLLNLLLRLWDTETGMIQINGKDIHQYHPERVREIFTLISQRNYLFSRSLRQNLRLANRSASDEEMIKAIETVELGEWFKHLPNGLETWLGEHGVKMSGGEKQRLMIARALLQDTPIWLLDEPTVHLDETTQNSILALLFRKTRGRSAIWIMHHFIEMHRMDEILVLQEGEIIERGIHLDLLQNNGLYAYLWAEQHRKIPVL